MCSRPSASSWRRASSPSPPGVCSATTPSSRWRSSARLGTACRGTSCSPYSRVPHSSNSLRECERVGGQGAPAKQPQRHDEGDTALRLEQVVVVEVRVHVVRQWTEHGARELSE